MINNVNWIDIYWWYLKVTWINTHVYSGFKYCIMWMANRTWKAKCKWNIVEVKMFRLFHRDALCISDYTFNVTEKCFNCLAIYEQQINIKTNEKCKITKMHLEKYAYSNLEYLSALVFYLRIEDLQEVIKQLLSNHDDGQLNAQFW